LSHGAVVFVFMSTWTLTWQGEGVGQLNAQCDPAYELTSSVNNYYQCNSLSHRKHNKHIT